MDPFLLFSSLFSDSEGPNSDGVEARRQREEFTTTLLQNKLFWLTRIEWE